MTLTAVNNITYGSNGLPVMTSAITIEGNGNTISRQSGSPDFRILAVGSGGNLTLNSATISGGIASGTFPAEYWRRYLLWTICFGNSVKQHPLRQLGQHGGGGIGDQSVHGDGVRTAPSPATRSTAPAAASTPLRLDADTNSTLSGNTAALRRRHHNCAGTLTVSNSTLSGNSAASPAAASCNSGTLTVQNSTLSGNSASSGGGIYIRSAHGHGLEQHLSGNSASTGGGGMRQL